MPIFVYKGYDSKGRPVKGNIESSGLNEAILKIKERGIFPSEVRSPDYSPSFFERFINSRPSFLTAMTNELSLLISSGVPLVEALQSLSNEERGYYRFLLMSLIERVNSGASLSKALEDFRDVFPDFYIEMVRAGEESGTLEKVLKRLSDFLNKREEMKSRLRSAMIYPLIMVAVSIIVLSFLFSFVIPRIAKIFSDTKAVLPLLTRIMISLSNLFIDYWWALLIFMILSGISIRLFIRKRREFIDRILLKLPGFTLKGLYYSRFARIMSFLIEGGVPLLKALDISAGVTGNRYLGSLIRSGRQKVAEGQNLSTALDGFAPVFLQIIATGEKSGRLAQSFERAATSYEENFTRALNRMVSMIEPAIIIIVGLIVGLIVAGVLLPMLQLNQLIKI